MIYKLGNYIPPSLSDTGFTRRIIDETIYCPNLTNLNSNINIFNIDNYIIECYETLITVYKEPSTRDDNNNKMKLIFIIKYFIAIKNLITKLNDENVEIKNNYFVLEYENDKLKNENAKLNDENKKIKDNHFKLNNKNVKLKDKIIKFKNENFKLKNENIKILDYEYKFFTEKIFKLVNYITNKIFK